MEFGLALVWLVDVLGWFGWLVLVFFGSDRQKMGTFEVVCNLVQYQRHVHALISNLPCFVGNSIFMMAFTCSQKWKLWNREDE